jgi:hypothetical protein
MLSKSDTSIDLIESDLISRGVETAFLVPTEVGLKKSILDAHLELKKFLSDNNLHDFEAQAKGSANKKVLPVNLIEKDSIKRSSVSLYRPDTKGGDPRLWISGLAKYAKPYNLLAIFLKGEELYIANASDKEIFETRLISGSPFDLILRKSDSNSNEPKKIDPAGSELSNQDNQFLQELLNLQQDGSESISAPSNWAQSEPLLKVETKLDDVIDDLLERVEKSPLAPEKIFWHFFIGSPGNGKSAAAGSLARKLIKAGYVIEDEAGNSLEDILPSQIPYLLKVSKKGNKFASLWIAQDASVVRNPYGVDADPSNELIDLIIDAASRAVSLVICTNRGVLEKASRFGSFEKEDQQSPWFLAIKNASEGVQAAVISLGEKKGDSKKIVVDSTNLEVQSLLFKSDIAYRLISTAIRDKNWDICNSCSASKKCPFVNNQKWLSTDAGKDTILSLLRYVELLSGQLIVFREFLAFLSLILAGSPTDYEDETPCQWVHKELASSNLFALVSRRIYMLLFSSYAPSGLEYSRELRGEQVRYIRELLDETPILPDQIRAAVQNVITRDIDDFVSTDVGVQRLLSHDGVLAKLDVNNSPLPSSFLGKWAIGSGAVKSLPEGLFSDLERTVIGIFDELSACIESSSSLGGKHYFWLSRWYTSFFFRIGSLAENVFSLGSEISRLAEILNAMQDDFANPALLKRIAKIETTLNDLLLGDGSGVRVSEYGRLKGKWVTEQLRPRMGSEDSLGALGVPVSFGPKEKEMLNAEAFSWLLRKVDTNMAMNSFPMQHLESVQDALVRAAALSDYSVAQDDIELEIGLPNSKSVLLTRFRGNVSAE